MYMTRNKLALLAVMVTTYAQFTTAEIHDVSVEDNDFSPNDLIINPGDTVRWQGGSRGDCGGEYGPDCVAHTVTADDFFFIRSAFRRRFLYPGFQ